MNTLLVFKKLSEKLEKFGSFPSFEVKILALQKKKIGDHFEITKIKKDFLDYVNPREFYGLRNGFYPMLIQKEMKFFYDSDLFFSVYFTNMKGEYHSFNGKPSTVIYEDNPGYYGGIRFNWWIKKINFHKKGILHNDEDKPSKIKLAVFEEKTNEYVEVPMSATYFKNGKEHRDNKPSYIEQVPVFEKNCVEKPWISEKRFMKEGKFHRLGKPAHSRYLQRQPVHERYFKNGKPFNNNGYIEVFYCQRCPQKRIVVQENFKGGKTQKYKCNHTK